MSKIEIARIVSRFALYTVYIAVGLFFLTNNFWGSLQAAMFVEAAVVCTHLLMEGDL